MGLLLWDWINFFMQQSSSSQSNTSLPKLSLEDELRIKDARIKVLEAENEALKTVNKVLSDAVKIASKEKLDKLHQKEHHSGV